MVILIILVVNCCVKLRDTLGQSLDNLIEICFEIQFPAELGVERPHARSRQSYWHMSKTIASGVGLTNAWLSEQGLLSLKTLWSELAPLRRNA